MPKYSNVGNTIYQDGKPFAFIAPSCEGGPSAQRNADALAKALPNILAVLEFYRTICTAYCVDRESAMLAYDMSSKAINMLDPNPFIAANPPLLPEQG